MDEVGQVSAELLIVIAALIAVSVVLVGQLQKTAKAGSAALANQTADVLKEIRKI